MRHFKTPASKQANMKQLQETILTAMRLPVKEEAPASRETQSRHSVQ